MRPTTRRDTADVESILALDWLVAPRNGLEYLEAVNHGRDWNNHIRSLQDQRMKAKNKKTALTRKLASVNMGLRD